MNRSKEFSGNGATGNLILMNEEVRAGDNTVSVQVTAPGTTVTLTYEVSNDGVTWYATAGVSPGFQAAPAFTSTSTAAGILVFMVQTRFFRVRVSTAGSGTVTGVAVFGEGSAR